MPSISLEARHLGVRLGVGSLIDRPVCHSYANGCRCPSCSDRAEIRLRVVTMGGADPLNVEPCEGGYVCGCGQCVAERAEILARGPRPDALAA